MPLRNLLLPAIIFLLALNVSGQGLPKTLRLKFLNADSVILVSHLWVPRIEPVEGEKEKKMPDLSLIKNGRINPESIIEKRIVGDSSLLKLVQIIMTPRSQAPVETAQCFMPHHAIILYKKDKLSFIDICFGCFRIRSSNDLKVSEDDFDLPKWKELYKFLKQQGLKYELEQFVDE